MDFKELVDISLPEQTIDKLTGGIQSELTVTNLSFRIPPIPTSLNIWTCMRNEEWFLKLDTFHFMWVSLIFI
jgi:hypothetical protein